MEELESSELGTKEYWDSRYKMEIDNHKNHGDPGEVWFGEDISDRIMIWIHKKNSSNLILKSSKIVDVGCGNGMFLVQLASQGFTNLCGVDYSEGAIKLAQSVAEKQGYSHLIQYRTCDILQGLQQPEVVLEDSSNQFYDVIHDKGTYDAISLMEDAKENRATYIKNVHESLTNDGWFLITSCNWTQEELQEQFQDYFRLGDVIPTPQFKFGGKTGSVVTCLAYKKKIKTAEIDSPNV